MAWSEAFMQRVVVVGAVVSFFASACFEVDPPPPPPAEGKGVIAGTINVGQVAGASAPNLTRIAQARDDVAKARGQHEAGRSIGVTGLGEIERERAAAPEEVEFVAGEALVLFERRAFDKATILPALRTMLERAGLSHVETQVKWCVGRRVCTFQLIDDKGFLDEAATLAAVRALRDVKLPRVRNFSTNLVHKGFRIPNDPLASLQWHYDAVKLPPAWDLVVGDPDLVVAVVDSGVKHANPDLRDKLARDPNNANQFVEFDFVSSPALELDDIGGIDLDAEDPGDNLFGSDPGEDSYHGTHIAGTIGAETDNRNGVAGVLWEAQIVPVRVLGQALSGNFDDIINGLFWAVGDPELDVGAPPNVRPARLVNLSLGAPDLDGGATQIWTELLDEIVDDEDDLIAQEPIFIAAAGNAAQDARQTTPANVPRMITVGATRFDGVRAEYSNFGSPIDVMAPGGEIALDQDDDGNDDGILSTWDADVKLEQGTSMSAPHVTGIAGLLVTARPELTHDTVHELLKNTANQSFRCNEGCGNGLVDAVQALIVAGAQLDPAPRLAVDSERVFFPTGIARQELRVLNLGNVPASFDVSFGAGDADLFTFTPASGTLDSGDNLTLTLTLARDGAEEGAVELVLTGTGEAAGQEVIVAVFFQDNPARPVRNLNVVEVGAFLRNGEGDLIPSQTALATRENNFAFEITGLLSGSYEVYAVGDDNNDGIFDSQQESFGAFPLADGVQAVVLEKNDSRVEGINFGVTLRSNFSLDGGVGSPCTGDTSATDCAGIDFAPGAACIDNFPGGYCSRLCGDDALCGVAGQCEVLECDGQPCAVCLQRCVSDVQCRAGYLCEFGTCAPAGF